MGRVLRIVYRYIATHLIRNAGFSRKAFQTCPTCGGAVRFCAGIEDPRVIEKVLTHLDKYACSGVGWVTQESRSSVCGLLARY